MHSKLCKINHEIYFDIALPKETQIRVGCPPYTSIRIKGYVFLIFSHIFGTLRNSLNVLERLKHWDFW